MTAECFPTTCLSQQHYSRGRTQRHGKLTTRPNPGKISSSTKLTMAYLDTMDRKSSEISIRSRELGFRTLSSGALHHLQKDADEMMAAIESAHLAGSAPRCGVPKNTMPLVYSAISPYVTCSLSAIRSACGRYLLGQPSPPTTTLSS